MRYKFFYPFKKKFFIKKKKFSRKPLAKKQKQPPPLNGSSFFIKRTLPKGNYTGLGVSKKKKCLKKKEFWTKRNVPVLNTNT